MKLFLTIFGKLLALTPEGILSYFCIIVGDLLYFIPNPRIQTTLSNLHHAFPERPLDDLKKIAREHCRRMVELSLLSIALPYFSENRFHKIMTMDEKTKDTFRELVKKEQPVLLLSPHFTLTEACCFIPKQLEGIAPPIGTIFRPFNNKGLDEYFKETRERFGAILLSRKSGFTKVMAMLREKQWGAILFDQNAGKEGALIHCFGRTASTTELPGLFVKKFDAAPVCLAFERNSFWRGQISATVIPHDGTPRSVTLGCNAWLENKLKESDNQCADWYWMHNRWKTQNDPSKRFRIEHKAVGLEDSIQYNKQSPKRTRIWIRLPNWLGDIIMAIPLIRAIQKGRPDAEITLLAQEKFCTWLKDLNICDQTIALPPKGNSRFSFFYSLRKQYPDTILQFTNSPRSDIEAFLTRCPQRFGMLRPEKNRPLLTHTWKLPSEVDESNTHQSFVWEQFLKHFGLLEAPDFSPLFKPTENTSRRTIGMICGSENSPEKRWSIEHWKQLIQLLNNKYPNTEIKLFGTALDNEITEEITRSSGNAAVTNRAGETNLTELTQELRDCGLIICNDTGGMHLANAAGTPVAVIYGPTNPIRTGPIFDAPRTIIQAPNSPKTGGEDIAKITPELVIEKIQTIL